MTFSQRASALLAITALLFLAACGGGSGGVGDVPRVDPGPTQSLTGLESPSFQDSEILPALARIYGLADTIIATDLPFIYQGQQVVVETRCFRSTCTAIDPDTGAGVTWDLTFSPAGYRVTGVGDKNGVHLAHGVVSRTVGNTRFSISTYGAWLDHSGFSIEYGRIDSGEFSGLELAAGSSLGNDTGTRPTGNATWIGLMVGGTRVNGTAQAIQGDARVIYNLSRNTLDAAFSRIYNLDTRQLHVAPSMNWNGVQVRNDGSFYGSISSVNEIQGRFYGPGHAEVGGVFEHPTAIGAFGANR